MVSRYSVIFLLAIFLSECRPATPPPTAPPALATGASFDQTLSPHTLTPAPDYVTQVRNAQYQLGTPDSLQVVQLVDGQFEQGTPGGADFISVHMTDFVATSDLDGDGVNEVAALISENYGGSGVFVFLAVYANDNGKLTFQNASMVDDRPQLNALSIGSGEIYLDAVIHGTDDPMCCPTWRTSRHYRLTDGQLDMADYATFTPDAKPRTITIESPANGTEVFTSVPVKGKVAIAPFENNLAYRIYDISGIELSAGPVSVSAANPGGAGTFDALIPLGDILSGTLIKIEVQDLSAKDGSLLGMDSVEL